jgi:hypothetical protein
MEILGKDTKRAPHREAFIPDLKILDVQRRLAGLEEHTDLRKVTHQGCQTRLVDP